MHDPTPPQPEAERSWLWHYGLSALALGLLGSGFVVLGHEARIDEPTDLDNAIHDWVVVHRGGWPWLTFVFRCATRFGNPDVATVATALVTFGLYALSRAEGGRVARLEPLVWLGVILGGRVLSILLKLVFRRDRPPILHRLVPETTYSFPSGHSVFAAVFFTMLGIFLARLIPASRPRIRLLAVASCAPLAVVVAASRIWLGVHYPTDVVGGLLLGVGWVFAVWMIRIGWEHWRGGARRGLIGDSH